MVGGNVAPLVDLLPDLLLARMVVGDRERHELFKRHAVLAVDLEQVGRDRCEPQALAHGRGRHEEARGNVLLGQTRLDQCAESAELVERVKPDAHDVLGQRILLGDAGLAHHAGHWLVLRHPPGLDQQFERTKAAAAGGHFEHAGFRAVVIEHRPDIQALEQSSAVDIIGQVLDREARLYAPDIFLAEHQLRERDIPRGAEHELGQGLGHGVSP